MVVSKTKTVNQTIIDGSGTHSVDATIISHPGFNGQYLGKIPGVLKVLELLLAAIALGLVAYRRLEDRLVENRDRPRFNGNYTEHPATFDETNRTGTGYGTESFLIGEVYFLCAHTAVITMLAVFLMTYLFHTVSEMIVPKASALESTMNLILAVMLIAAGIVELVMTIRWKSEIVNGKQYPLMFPHEEGVRLAAGVLALINGILFLVSFYKGKKEFDGPMKTM